MYWLAKFICTSTDRRFTVGGNQIFECYMEDFGMPMYRFKLPDRLIKIRKTLNQIDRVLIEKDSTYIYLWQYGKLTYRSYRKDQYYTAQQYSNNYYIRDVMVGDRMQLRVRYHRSGILDRLSTRTMQIFYFQNCLCFSIDGRHYTMDTSFTAKHRALPDIINAQRITEYMFGQYKNFIYTTHNIVYSIYDDELFDFTNEYFTHKQRIEHCITAVIQAWKDPLFYKEKITLIQKRTQQLAEQLETLQDS